MNSIFSAGDGRWHEPVYLRIGYGMPEAVRSPREAHNHLLFRWPTIRGENMIPPEASASKPISIPC